MNLSVKEIEIIVIEIFSFQKSLRWGRKSRSRVEGLPELLPGGFFPEIISCILLFEGPLLDQRH